MCLAIPAKVKSISGTTAEVDLQGNTTQADVTLLPDVNVGDYIIMHAGCGIQIYDEKEAEETLELIREMEEKID